MQRVVGNRRIWLVKRTGVIAVLSVIGLTMLVPFYVLVVESFHPNLWEFPYPVRFIPERISLENYQELLAMYPVMRWLGNSFIISGGTSILQIAICSLAAFGFSRTRFRFRGILFAALMVMLVVPIQTRVLPLFILMARLRWLNSYLAWLPFISEALGIFLFRQYMQTIPRELDESVYMDGASQFQAYLWLIMPLVMPAVIVLFTFNFIREWNDFLYPLIVINRTEMFTVQLGLANVFSSAQEAEGPSKGLALAASTIALLPTLLVYLLLQNYIVEGIRTYSGIKG